MLEVFVFTLSTLHGESAVLSAPSLTESSSTVFGETPPSPSF